MSRSLLLTCVNAVLTLPLFRPISSFLGNDHKLGKTTVLNRTVEGENTRNAQGLSFLSSDLIHVAAFDGPPLINAFNCSDKAAVATYLKQQLKPPKDYFFKN